MRWRSRSFTRRFWVFEDADGGLIDSRKRKICAGFAFAHEAEINVDSVVAQAHPDTPLTMGPKDMADLLTILPGAFFNLGQHGDMPPHAQSFIFDDPMVPLGASVFARFVDRRGLICKPWYNQQQWAARAVQHHLAAAFGACRQTAARLGRLFVLTGNPILNLGIIRCRVGPAL